MSFFQLVVLKRGLKRHDGRPLWKYSLTEKEYQELRENLKFKNNFTIDPRDATLYYAEWWKNNYDGGKPSKQEIFDSLNATPTPFFNAEDFYQAARKGAEMLNYQWIRKQYTLYFRTLLLQGGLPLKHIGNNESNYLDFLLAVMNVEPERIEDIMVEPDIVSLLPISSRNKPIYENCLAIVRSILAGDDIYEDLFKTNKIVENIAKELKVKKSQIQRRKRRTKPKNYWLLHFNNGNPEIHLQVGFLDTYTAEELGDIMGIQPSAKQIHFYINDELICVFRKMLSGNYKTHWQHNQNFKWNGKSRFPETQIVIEGERREVRDFIQITPNLYEPSLWSKFSEDEWRLMKGNGSPNKEAAVLFPKNWNSILETETVMIQEQSMLWSVFEGEVKLSKEEEKRIYLSNVRSIDWVIHTNRPWWMKRASLPVVVGKPEVSIYDAEGKKELPKDYSLWVKKRNRNGEWHNLNRLYSLDKGCFDLKIIKGDLVGYDSFFNIDKLNLDFEKQASNYAEIKVVKNSFDIFRLDETEFLNISENENIFELNVNTEKFQIPNTVSGAVGLRNQKKLFFNLESPFEGTCIVDSEGFIIPETQSLLHGNLYGLRILSKKNKNTNVTLFNPLAPHVEINKPIKERYQSIVDIDSENEMIKLFYLKDVMHHDSRICLKISDNRQSKTYHISRFSHTLNIDQQYDRKLYLENSDDDLDLYAVPVKGTVDDIVAIPLVRKEDYYVFPENITQDEFIIISAITDGKQLMPRFVSLVENDEFVEKRDRIKSYHDDLLINRFEEEPWQQLLAYFEICNQFDIPYSTFDQIRAISISPEVATRAFFFFTEGINDMDRYIQQVVPALEKDLGFCFHWAYKEYWKSAINEFTLNFGTEVFKYIIKLFTDYFNHNNLGKLANFIFRDNTSNSVNIGHSQIAELRQYLGNKVLNQLPKAQPIINSNYGIPIKHHSAVKLLLSSPIAIAESITGVDTDYPIWGFHEALGTIRRNIQYSQSLNPDFYSDTILHVLQRS